jgi:hypothetical protein
MHMRFVDFPMISVVMPTGYRAPVSPYVDSALDYLIPQ